MVDRKSKTRSSIKRLLGEQDNEQQLLFQVSDKPLRKALFEENCETRVDPDKSPEEIGNSELNR